MKMDAVMPILLLLLCIVILIGCVAYGVKKVVKLTDENARRVEIFGYLTLFVLLIWQYVVKSIVMKDFYLDDYYLNEKINTIFYALNSIACESNAQAQWHSYYMQLLEDENATFISTQLLCIDVIETVLQIISTVCIAIGRFQELAKKGNVSTDKQVCD